MVGSLREGGGVVKFLSKTTFLSKEKIDDSLKEFFLINLILFTQNTVRGIKYRFLTATFSAFTAKLRMHFFFFFDKSYIILSKTQNTVR